MIAVNDRWLQLSNLVVEKVRDPVSPLGVESNKIAKINKNPRGKKRPPVVGSAPMQIKERAFGNSGTIRPTHPYGGYRPYGRHSSKKCYEKSKSRPLFRGGQPPHIVLHVYPRFGQQAGWIGDTSVPGTPTTTPLGRCTSPRCKSSKIVGQMGSAFGYRVVTCGTRLARRPSTIPKVTAAVWWWYSESELRGARVQFS